MISGHVQGVLFAGDQIVNDHPDKPSKYPLYYYNQAGASIWLNPTPGRISNS